MSIAPISYNPDVNDTQVTLESGIGITFTERIKAGTGNITLRLVSAGGTVVENFGVGSSVTINNNLITIDPTANLSDDTVYHLSYPSGAFTNTAGDVSYVGTAYTFATKPLVPAFFMWGMNWGGSIPMGYVSDNNVNYSSPTQLPGTTWSAFSNHNRYGSVLANRTDGTLWAWGHNAIENWDLIMEHTIHHQFKYLVLHGRILWLVLLHIAPKLIIPYGYGDRISMENWVRIM